MSRSHGAIAQCPRRPTPFCVPAASIQRTSRLAAPAADYADGEAKDEADTDNDTDHGASAAVRADGSRTSAAAALTLVQPAEHPRPAGPPSAGAAPPTQDRMLLLSEWSRALRAEGRPLGCDGSESAPLLTAFMGTPTLRAHPAVTAHLRAAAEEMDRKARRAEEIVRQWQQQKQQRRQRHEGGGAAGSASESGGAAENSASAAEPDAGPLLPTGDSAMSESQIAQMIECGACCDYGALSGDLAARTLAAQAMERWYSPESDSASGSDSGSSSGSGARIPIGADNVIFTVGGASAIAVVMAVMKRMAADRERDRDSHSDRDRDRDRHHDRDCGRHSQSQSQSKSQNQSQPPASPPSPFDFALLTPTPLYPLYASHSDRRVPLFVMPLVKQPEEGFEIESDFERGPVNSDVDAPPTRGAD